MAPEDVIQERFVDLRLLEELLNPRQILVASDAGRDGDDVLRAEKASFHAVSAVYPDEL